MKNIPKNADRYLMKHNKKKLPVSLNAIQIEILLRGLQKVNLEYKQIKEIKNELQDILQILSGILIEQILIDEYKEEKLHEKMAMGKNIH